MSSLMGLLAALAVVVTYQPAVARLDLAPGAGGYPYCIGPKCDVANAIEGPVGSITVQADEPLELPAGDQVTIPVCKNNTNRLDTTDCHNYFACVNGTHWVRRSCGPDEAFSPYLDICTRREYVPCHTSCNVEGKFKDDFNCHEFWVCVQKRPYKFRCANGTVYSEATGRCEEGFCKEDFSNNVPPQAAAEAEPIPVLVPERPNSGGAGKETQPGGGGGESSKNGSRPVIESCVCYGKSAGKGGVRRE